MCIRDRYYYDPEIFDREKQEIWFKTWQLVGYQHELSEPVLGFHQKALTRLVEGAHRQEAAAQLLD